MTIQTPERLITRTMRGIGFLGRHATPKAAEIEDVFDTLVDMMASWNLEELLLPYTVMTSLTLVANQGTYLIGPTGADLVITPRPEKLKDLVTRTGASPGYIDLPVKLVETYAEWIRIISKLTTASRVSTAWYNPKSPNAELYVNPVPSEAGTIILYYQDKFTAFADLVTPINLPDGFIRAIRYNLGVEIAPELGVALPQYWLEKAVASKAAIMARNIEHGKLELEVPGMSARYDVASDSYRQ